jgi:hypothetical protein
MQRLQAAAQRNSIAVVMGYRERQGAIRYMSQVFIDSNGAIIGNRRKLKPTHMERTVYGEGDGSDFFVHEFPFGRVGALNCWEHFQPLSKFMMYSLHEQIHVAGWPSMLYQPGAPQVSIKTSETVTCSYAVEGSCFVLCSTQVYGKAAQEIFCDTKNKKELIPLGGGFAQLPRRRIACQPACRRRGGNPVCGYRPEAHSSGEGGGRSRRPLCSTRRAMSPRQHQRPDSGQVCRRTRESDGACPLSGTNDALQHSATSLAERLPLLSPK